MKFVKIVMDVFGLLACLLALLRSVWRRAAAAVGRTSDAARQLAASYTLAHDSLCQTRPRTAGRLLLAIVAMHINFLVGLCARSHPHSAKALCGL